MFLLKKLLKKKEQQLKKKEEHKLKWKISGTSAKSKII